MVLVVIEIKVAFAKGVSIFDQIFPLRKIELLIQSFPLRKKGLLATGQTSQLLDSLD